MTIEVPEWEPRVREHFDFLTDWGFRRTTASDSDWWETWVQYESQASAIRVVYSVEYRRSLVKLIRLVEGKVPEIQVWVSDEQINRTDLANVIEVRRPDDLATAHALHGLSRADLDKSLRFWAEVLRLIAADFLAGDLRVFAEVDALIRERLQRNPQRLTISISADASDEEEAAARRQAEEDVPRGVEVVVRRYRPPS